MTPGPVQLVIVGKLRLGLRLGKLGLGSFRGERKERGETG